MSANIVDYRAIGDATTDQATIEGIFGDIGYTQAEDREARKLLRVKRGSAFNLSANEIARFRSLGRAGDGSRELVSATMADVLRLRHLAYIEHGLEAVEPYARRGRKLASPRRELTVAFSALELLQRHFPDFYTSLLGFPADASDDTVNRFFWVKRLFDERPTFVLVHRMEQHTGDYVIAAELQYYVNHSYNSMLTLIACVPVESGTLVLSINRLFTDQVTGVASRTKKKIGRQKVIDAFTRHFEELRDDLEQRAEVSDR